MNDDPNDYPREFQSDEAALVGHILMAWSKVELMLHRMFQALGNFEPYIARLLSSRLNAASLVDTCRSLAVSVENDHARLTLLDWLKDVDEVRVERNSVIHSTWAHLYAGNRGAWIAGTMSTRIDKKSGQSEDVFTAMDLEKLTHLRARTIELAFRKLPTKYLAPMSDFSPTRAE